MALDRKKKQDLADEIAGTSDYSAPMGVEDLSVDAAVEPAAPAAPEDPASEDLGDMGDTGATSGESASDSLDDLLGEISNENSPLIPDSADADADAKALENEAKGNAIAAAQGGGRSKGMSAGAAKKKAEREKKNANKVAAYKAESAAKEQKEKIKRQRTIASQQNKTARERILRGETGARGRMFNRINAKFQIPDAPANFPRIGGSGTEYN